jgi:hypothetical protein
LPKLSRDQLVEVERELIKGAEAHGYPNDVWTLLRVAQVIEWVTSVSSGSSGSSIQCRSHRKGQFGQGEEARVLEGSRAVSEASEISVMPSEGKERRKVGLANQHRHVPPFGLGADKEGATRSQNVTSPPVSPRKGSV